MKNSNRKGGGYGSSVNREVGLRTGGPRREVSPKGSSQIGSALGDHATDRRQRSPNAVEPVFTGRQGISVPLGNALSAAVERKPGGSREVQRSGSQGVHGAPNPGLPKPGNAGKDLLSDFGPDSMNVRGRR